MKIRWDQKLDILGPIEQATRCLDIWFKEESRRLPTKQKQRAAALLARYFLHEDRLTDDLILSFLRHYSGVQNIDMEDPTSVRMEIKAILDRSVLQDIVPGRKKRLAMAFVIGGMIATLSLGLWEITHQRITRDQQVVLKEIVHRVAELDQAMTTAAVWSVTKKPLQIKSYQDMTRWDYYQSRKKLENRLQELEKSASSAAGTRM